MKRKNWYLRIGLGGILIFASIGGYANPNPILSIIEGELFTVISWLVLFLPANDLLDFRD